MTELQLKDILDFLVVHIPVLITALGIGHYLGSNEVKKLKNKVLDLEVAIEKKENAEAVEKKYEAVSELDVVNSIIKSGSSKS